LASAPAVSVLVTNRDGAGTLSRFLESYAEHHAADMAELVILDHASTDHSVETVRAWMDRLPIQLLRCNRNQRYSVANNLARRYARGRVLVFANNDVAFDEPVLPALVAALDDETVGLAGVELWYPGAEGERSGRCQHLGIRFAADPGRGFMRPFNVQAAEDVPLPGRDPGDDPVPSAVPAVTAALAACRAADFDAVGGFVPAYDYGFEDVDLALTLRRQLGKGSVLCPVGALHQEFGTQDREPEAVLTERRAANARILRCRHGAWLARAVTDSQLGFGGQSTGGPWHKGPLKVRLPVGVPVPPEAPRGLSPVTAADCPDAREFAGVWLVDDPEELTEAPPRRAVCVVRAAAGSAAAWVAAPGFRHVDAVLCEQATDDEEIARHSRAFVSRVSREAGSDGSGLGWLPGLLESLLSRPGVAIKTATPDEAERGSWGDFHFAEALGRALRDLGFRVRNDLHPDWHRPAFMPDDVSLVLRGLESSSDPMDGIELLWLISHPARVPDAELERFDHVFVASGFYADLLASRLATPVSALLQCTDPARFQFVESPDAVARRLFVGNSKGYFRPMIRAALAAGETVDIYGTWWHEHIDQSLIRGEAVPNEALGVLYGNSGVVLNDHWPDMARLGFLSNRLFDVAATGALIVTDPVRGLADVFGEEVVIAEGLPERFPRLDELRIADRASRRALSDHVRREHTFAARAAEIAAVLARLGVMPDP
jgi:GT2 family glycosyltransferase